MAITRTKKEELIKDIHQKTESAKFLIMISFSGVSVNQINQLRKDIKNVGAQFNVVKKTLLNRVLDAFGFSGDKPETEGEIAVVFSHDDSPDAAKIIYEFAKEHDSVKISGGVMDGGYVSDDSVKQLALIPSREILLGQLVGLMSSPIRGMVGVMNGPIKNMVGIISQLSKK